MNVNSQLMGASAAAANEDVLLEMITHSEKIIHSTAEK